MIEHDLVDLTDRELVERCADLMPVLHDRFMPRYGSDGGTRQGEAQLRRVLEFMDREERDG